MDASRVAETRRFAEACKKDLDRLNTDLPAAGFKIENTDDIEGEDILESDLELEEAEIVLEQADHLQRMGNRSMQSPFKNIARSDEEHAKGLNCLKLGQLEDTIKHFTNAIVLYPFSAEKYNYRAYVFRKMKKPKAALRDANAAFEIDRDNILSFKERGFAHAMLGNWEQAALDLAALGNIGYEEDELKLKMLVGRNMEKIMKHRMKYQRLRKEREEKKAERNRLSCHAEAQDAYDCLDILGARLFAASLKAPNTSPMDEFDDEEDDNLKNHVNKLAEDLGEEICEFDVQFKGAILSSNDDDSPQKVEDLSVQDRINAAVAAISQEKLEEAIVHLTEAIRLNPQSAIIYGTRAALFIKVKKPAAALHDANAALEINPASVKVHSTRGMAYAMLGKWEDAAADFRAILNEQHPEPMSVFGDPEVMAALQNVITTPANLAKYEAHPKVGPIITKLKAKFLGSVSSILSVSTWLHLR